MFLGIYVLFLTAVPCHCHELLMQESAVRSGLTVSTSPCDGNETEMCTPFCCCTAVHGVNFFFVESASQFVEVKSEKLMTTYFASMGKAFRIKLRRPPIA